MAARGERCVLLALVLLVGSVGVAGAEDLTAPEQRLAERATALSQQADAEYERGRYAEATQLLQEALTIREQLYPKGKYPQGHTDLALSLNDLGTLLKAQGDYGKALACYQKALAMFESLYPRAK
jgi:tetratricopeptide (TPR) repeat protein